MISGLPIVMRLKSAKSDGRSPGNRVAVADHAVGGDRRDDRDGDGHVAPSLLQRLAVDPAALASRP